ncbi:DUF2188 domain-containing protein [Agromyces bauzanensis]
MQVPELDTVGQARSAAEVEEVAREVIGLWLDVEPDTFDVAVSIEIPGDAREAWEESKRREAIAREETAAAAALARQAVASLRADGLTFKDAGVVLELSAQRVQQLAASAEPEPVRVEEQPVRVEEVVDISQALRDALSAGDWSTPAEVTGYYVHGGEADDNRFVVPNGKRGGWDVLKEDHEHASAHFATQAEAIARAREIVENSRRDVDSKGSESRPRRHVRV